MNALTPTLLRKTIAWLLWLAFVGYTLWIAPLDHPTTAPVVKKLLTLKWAELNPYVVALFSLMGVWPMIYACLMFADGRMQRFPAWLFFLGSNIAGVISILPYLALREPSQTFLGRKDRLLKSLDARTTGVILSVITLGLFSYAGFAGNLPNFIHQLQTTPFLYMMSLDFCSLCLVFPFLLGDDMARRGWRDRRRFWPIALLPLLGPLAYLCLRPPLPETAPAQSKVPHLTSFLAP